MVVYAAFQDIISQAKVKFLSSLSNKNMVKSSPKFRLFALSNENIQIQSRWQAPSDIRRK